MNNKKNSIIEKNFAKAFQNHQKNNFEIAESYYKKNLKKDFNHFKSIFYLSALYLQTKRFDLAKPLLLKAIQIEPNNAVAHYNLGLLYKELRKYQKASSYYEKAIQIQPNNINALNNFGNLQIELGEYQKAISSFEKAIQIQPNNAIYYNILGNVLGQLGEYHRASSSYEMAIKIQPDYADAHNNLGNALKELGEYQKAISSYKKAIRIRDNSATTYYNLALVYKELGDQQKAKDSYEKAVKYEPENLIYLFDLSQLKKEILDFDLRNKIFEIIESKNSTKENIAYGNFLLSKYELKSNNYENEVNYLLKAHNNFFEAKNLKFKNEVDYWLNVLPKRKEIFNLNKYNNDIIKKNHSIKPIFIIGVPRCGSTLIEKIIASGKKYIPIGEETGIIHKTVKKLINGKRQLNLELNHFYNETIEMYKKKKLILEKSNFIFTDKSLENFFYLNIINKIFPKAKVINCMRDTPSSIMSTLKNNQVFLAWAHKLENIFKYYDLYHKIINNFEKENPNFIYHLQYEKFINDPENESKKLMKFCDLPWDIKCLEFYNRGDLISKTASNMQIRKSIYKDSNNKHSPYKNFLSKYGSKYSWFD